MSTYKYYVKILKVVEKLFRAQHGIHQSTAQVNIYKLFSY